MVVFSFSMLSLTGLWLCFSILQYANGQGNRVAGLVCGRESNCNRLLAAGRIYKFIHLEDIGIWWFAGQLLFLLFAAITGKIMPSLTVIAVPAAITVLGSFFSIAYQAFIARTWCRLCLLVISVLWTQAVMLAFYFHTTYHSWLLSNIDTTTCLLFITCFLLSATWFAIKPVYVQARHAQKYRDKLAAWKLNPVFFHTLLRQQRRLVIEPVKTDIVLGNPAADLQLLAVLNPYCGHCKRSFSQLKEMAENFPGKLHIRIRFKLQLTGIKKDRSLKAVRHILSVYLHTDDANLKTTLLSYWFATMRLRSWRQRFGSVPDTIDELTVQLESTEKWMGENNISYTPTLFINGYEMPDSYTLQDITSLVPVLYQPARVVTVNRSVKE